MERNGILLAGKKILSTIALTSLAILPLQADLQMTLMDKDGTEIKECIKSYSFSNNLESLAKQKGVAQDVYSEEETLTNKILFGKPVYRKLFRFTIKKKDLTINTGLTGIYRAELSNFTIYGTNGFTVNSSDTFLMSKGGEIRAFTSTNGTQIVVRVPDGHKDFDNVTGYVILEYIKTIDVVNTTPNTFKSYIHYIPSSSTTDEVTTKDLENKGVIFDKNYTYDSSTDSCIKN